MVTRVLTNLALGVIIVLWFCFIAFYLVKFGSPREQVIDCTWVEISPDFTPQAREACRKHRMEQVK